MAKLLLENSILIELDFRQDGDPVAQAPVVHCDAWRTWNTFHVLQATHLESLEDEKDPSIEDRLAFIANLEEEEG